MRKIEFFILSIVVLSANDLFARECPSKLNAHNFDITENLSIGAELRFFYLGVDVGENLPISGITQFDNNYLGGLRLSLTYFPINELSVVIEGEIRYKNPGWIESNGFSIRPWQGYVQYDSEHLFINGGLQIIQFGTAALLDERFIAIEGGYKSKGFELSIFGGVTHNWLLRSSSNCLWIKYTSQTEGWKTISPDFQNYLLGLKGGIKFLKPHQVQILYLYSRPSFEELRSSSFSIYAKGPIIKKRLSYILEPLVIFNRQKLLVGEEQNSVYAVVFELRYHIPIFENEPLLTLGTATVLSDVDEKAINPVYENLSWGYIKRYSLRNGHLGEIKLLWEAKEYLKPYANYFIQSFDYSSSTSSDELDAGIIFEFMKGLITLNTSFVALNMAGPYRPSYGAYLELRTIIGKE